MAYKEKHAAGFDRITVADVLKKLFEVWKPNAATETIPMERSVGRILAADVRSVNTLPVVRSSGRDGYAVRSADFANGHPDTSAWTLGADYIRADTGDDFDDAFDAVVKVENAHFDENNHFRVNDGIEVKSGLDVNGRGSQIKEGDLILAKGFPIRGYDLGSFAQGGVTEVTVVSKPKVIFIPTGNELIPAGQKPERGQNIDSNSVLVKQMLTELGADVKCTPIISDNVVDLETSLDAAVKDADIVILNGGTSKGLDDHNAEILENRGEVICHGVLAAPGRPVCVTVINGKAVINTSGPMIAAYYAINWCLRPVIARWFGVPEVKPQTVTATLTTAIGTPNVSDGAELELLYRLYVSKTADGYEAEPITFPPKTAPRSKGFPNGQFISVAGKGNYPKGSEIEVQLLYPIEFIY